jgi:hypothetical protein
LTLIGIKVALTLPDWKFWDLLCTLHTYKYTRIVVIAMRVGQLVESHLPALQLVEIKTAICHSWKLFLQLPKLERLVFGSHHFSAKNEPLPKSQLPKPPLSPYFHPLPFLRFSSVLSFNIFIKSFWSATIWEAIHFGPVKATDQICNCLKILNRFTSFQAVWHFGMTAQIIFNSRKNKFGQFFGQFFFDQKILLNCKHLPTFGQENFKMIFNSFFNEFFRLTRVAQLIQFTSQ